MKTIVFALLVLSCFSQNDFKGTQKSGKGTGAPPNIQIPHNLRLKLNITKTFGFGVGLDIVSSCLSYRLLIKESLSSTFILLWEILNTSTCLISMKD